MLYWLIVGLFGFGFLIYIRAKFKKRTSRKVDIPRSTWIIWTIIDLLTVFGLTGEGSGVTPLSVVALFGAVAMLIIALRWGTSGWSTEDYMAGAGVLVGTVAAIVLWSKDALVITIQCISFLGSIPLFVTVWKRLEKEWLTFLLWLFASALSFLLTDRYTAVNLAQPINFTLAFLIVLVLMAYRSEKTRSRSQEPSYGISTFSDVD